MKISQLSIRRRVLAACMLLTLSTLPQLSVAAPVVSGNTITVGSDGWYQIQSAADFSTLCEGTSSCVVATGEYIIINHTSGERFENIVVSGAPDNNGGENGGASSVQIQSNTISWPDDGWYQVQSSVDYATVCEGGRSCDVTLGNYIVINHSTGERFNIENVDSTVAGTTPENAAGFNYTVNDNVVSWTGDDWFQIQTADDYQTICEGGNSCRLNPGSYNIINHSLNQRIDNFTVGPTDSGNNTAIPTTPLNLTATVYSDSQAELFWEASTSDSLLMGYDIFRNGELLVQRLDGRSYFESSLEAGSSYSYQVFAVDQDGDHSEPATVQLTTTGGTEPTPGPATDTIAAALAPIVDGNNQVSWAFSPIDSEIHLLIEPFVEMPLANNGNPARWNAMATLGERIFVVDEQDGRIYEITNRQANLWFDIARAISETTGRTLNTDNPFHGGVRGLSFHPDFANNGLFYTSLMEQRPSNPGAHHYLSDSAALNADSVLVEWRSNLSTMEVDPSSYREVFRVGIPEYDHPIKQIAFHPTESRSNSNYGLLYIAHGDGSKESTTTIGGQGNNALGKILRINPLSNNGMPYSLPSDNPFIGNATMLDEVYSLGHRNPHHLAFTKDGTLLVGEDGRDNIDEVNLITAGADYGWSVREGAYVQLDQGTLANGVTTLPPNDADYSYTYPVAQFGHTGGVGATFTGQALGGGFVMENGSVLDGHYFYIDFPKSGEVFHSSMASIRSAVTRGAPWQLTVAKTWRASVSFNHDNNPDTAALNMTLKEIIQSAPAYGNTDRVDVRYGQGPRGELYLMNKRNNVIYLVSNSLPIGTETETGNPASSGPVSTGQPAFDNGTHGFNIWSSMSAAAKAVTPTDCLLSAPREAGPFYCFSPYDRRLMRIENAGNIFWQFSLPGDNANNHIESISFVNGVQIATIADATPSPNDSAFDMSIFNQSGAYQGTYHIIPDIENPNGVDFAGVNLNGLDLIVRTGPTRQLLPSGPEDQIWRNDLYIYAEHYSEIPGADNTQLTGWRNEGAFRVRLDTINGNSLNTTLFPGLSAQQALLDCPVPSSTSLSPDSC